MKRFRRRARRGQALVEFALVMPIFLSLLLGLMELSMIYATATLYNSAAYQAARTIALAGAQIGTIDQTAVSALLATAEPLFVARVEAVEIYLTNAQGSAPQSSAENSFTGTGTAQSPQTWSIASRLSTLTAPLYVGVRITYRYLWFTSFLSASGVNLTLHASAIVPLALVGG